MALHEMAIIGAGPVGLAIAKAFGETGIPYAQYEATDHVGGNWAHGVYETAHIISSRRTTEFPDHPMPADWPDFPSAAQMKRYYEGFAEAYRLGERIRFNAEVTRAAPTRDGAWEVEVGGVVERFKGVVVCNGHHWKKLFPPWIERYTGEVLHSKDYKRPDQIAGRSVLVVGGGNSGCDLASEAARVAARADWSLRRGYHFLPKSFFGVPTVELLRGWMPVSMQRGILKALVRVTVGPYSRYGLPEPDHELYEAHPTINSEVFHYLSHGRIKPRPDVADVAGTTVRFVDGTEQTYDMVVCATGFDVTFPFLPEGMVPVNGKVAELFGLVRPGVRHLYVFGTTQPRYGLGPLVRPGALLLTDLVKLQDEVQIPLGDVLRATGLKPETSHLQDPHEVMTRVARARRMMPILRWRAKRMDAALRRPAEPLPT